MIKNIPTSVSSSMKHLFTAGKFVVIKATLEGSMPQLLSTLSHAVGIGADEKVKLPFLEPNQAC